MPIDKNFLEEMIVAAKKDQQESRANFLKQEGVIAFCELLLKKLDEEGTKPK